MLTDKRLHKALVAILTYALFSVPLLLVVALAMLLNRRGRKHGEAPIDAPGATEEP